MVFGQEETIIIIFPSVEIANFWQIEIIRNLTHSYCNELLNIDKVQPGVCINIIYISI